MVRKFSFVFMLLYLVSCYTENKPEVNPPDKLMPEAMIVDVLTDLQLAEGIIANQRSGKTSPTKEFKDSLYQIIFDRYDITSSELNENLDYYNSDPEHMEKIYEEVLSRLSQKETEIKIASKPADTIPDAE